MPKKPRVSPAELLDKLTTKGQLSEDDQSDIPWNDIERYARDTGFSRATSAPQNLDTIEGQAQVLKDIIAGDKEKTENRIRSIELLSELRGTKKLRTEDLKRLPSEDLLKIIGEDVIAALRPFRVKKAVAHAV